MEVIISTYYTSLNTHRSINSMLHGISLSNLSQNTVSVSFFWATLYNTPRQYSYVYELLYPNTNCILYKY